jgi:hypothetical protein
MQKWKPIFDTPLSPEREKEAREMLAEVERARQLSIEQYDRDGLPPFMRLKDDTSGEEPVLSDQELPAE